MSSPSPKVQSLPPAPTARSTSQSDVASLAAILANSGFTSTIKTGGLGTGNPLVSTSKLLGYG